MNEETFKINELMDKTNEYRNIETVVLPDENNPQIPRSVFKYQPVTWMEDGVYHTLFGSLPHQGIWTLGTTALESMQEFDKELQVRLKGNDAIAPIAEEKRQQIHKEVFQKINRIMGWNS